VTTGGEVGCGYRVRSIHTATAAAPEARGASTAGDPEQESRYDVALVFEAIHDLDHPIEALAGCRRALKPGAPLIVMDERVAEELTAPGDEVERFMAAISVVWCTPQGHGPGSEVVGAVMRPRVLDDLARRAGFTNVEVLEIEQPFWRFYCLMT
jgi:hypothetical protein